MSDDPFTSIAAEFGKGLGVKPAATGGGYRGAAETPLEGEWLGGYSEPRMFEPFSPMRVLFSAGHGVAEDDSGESEWTLVAKRGHDHDWFKTYAQGEWSYRGRKQPHAVVGAWTSVTDPRRVGCFWLVPADRLPTAHADKLRRGAARRFWPAIGAQMLSLACVAGAIIAMAVSPWWLFPVPFLLIWLALKDSLRIAGAAKKIFDELDTPAGARVEIDSVTPEEQSAFEFEGETDEEQLLEEETSESHSA